MKKRLVAVLLVMVMTIAAAVVPASAANYDNIDYKTNGLHRACDWLGINSWDNLNIYVQDGSSDGYGKAVENDQLDQVYGCILFATVADPAIGINIVCNSTNTGWVNGDTVYPVQYDGDIYYFTNFASTPYFENTNEYTQFCLCNWGGQSLVLTGIAILDKNGEYMATVGECPASPVAAAPSVDIAVLPQTGVVSGVALYAIGTALVGCGAVVVKKSRKED